MIKKLMLKIINNGDSLSTYKTGLLQAKAYRILKQMTAKELDPYHLTSIDWALLGLLFESPEGFKLVEIADLLGVESPFVTVLIDKLEEKKLVTRVTSKHDKRAKLILLTPEAQVLVPQIEKTLRARTKELLAGAGITDVIGYIKVLSKIVENNET